MGCGASNTLDNEPPIKFEKKSVDQLSQLRENFVQKQKWIKYFKSSNGVFSKDLEHVCDRNHDDFEAEFPQFYEKYKSALDQKLFPNSDAFKEQVLNISAQLYISTWLKYTEYNMAELLTGMAKELKHEGEFSESDVTNVEELLKNVGDRFPSRQKGFIYSPDSIKSCPFAYAHVNNNFLYNTDFEFQAMNLILTRDRLENLGYMNGIAEVIDNSRNLISVCIQLFDKYDDNEPFENDTIKSLTMILDAVARSNSIRAFTIVLGKSEKPLVDLGASVNDKIVEILKKDSLSFVYFYRISFNSDFGKKIGSALPSLTNLRFFGILSSDKDFSYLNDIFHGVSRNNSLSIVLLQNFDISETKLNEFKALAAGCKSLRLLKYYRMKDFQS